jgi:c-di-GMP-binding flagellar brake protein YcgR
MFEERRRQKRVDVNLPIRVKWSDNAGNRREEVTKSINVSADGAIFLLKEALKMGTVLELSLPLPRHMQKGVSPKPIYEAIGLVTRVEHAREAETFRIAVRFRAANTKQYRSES